MKKEKVEITGQRIDEYVKVPIAWFEQLITIAKNAKNDDKLGKQYLLGYISSAETILKYARRK